MTAYRYSKTPKFHSEKCKNGGVLKLEATFGILESSLDIFFNLPVDLSLTFRFVDMDM